MEVGGRVFFDLLLSRICVPKSLILILCPCPPPPPGRPTQRGPFSATSDGHIVRAHTQPSSPRDRAKCTPFSLVLSVTGHPHTGTHTDTHTPAHTQTHTHTHTHYTHADTQG